MRIWLIALIGSALIGVGLLPQLRDALEMRAMIEAIEGVHELDLVAGGMIEGRYRSEFRRLPDGGFVSRYTLSMSPGDTSTLASEQALEFSGFPSYSLRAVRVRQGRKEITHEASNLPEWSLYQHLIVQRLALHGFSFLERAHSDIDVLSSERQGQGRVLARIKAPVFDAREAKISFTELELDWQGGDGVTLHRDGAWFDYDHSGRIERAQFTPSHKLLPPGNAQESLVGHGRVDRSMVPLLGPGIEHPDEIDTLLIDIGKGAQAPFDSDEYLPRQSLHGHMLTLRAGPQHPLPKIRELVSLVHHSLVYDESINATDVDEIIENGRGDCTEFTDLFHAKAKAAGLEARKILGLAYLVDYAGRPPGFYVHAWNQVLVDGAWTDVDATWNQAPASAARIRFPQKASAMALLEDIRLLELTLVGVSYEDGQHCPWT